MLILVISSKESPMQLLKCIYNHGPLIFDIIGGGQQIISQERLLVLGRLLGIDSLLLDAKKQRLQSIVSFDDFQLFYFDIF